MAASSSAVSAAGFRSAGGATGDGPGFTAADSAGSVRAGGAAGNCGGVGRGGGGTAGGCDAASTEGGGTASVFLADNGGVDGADGGAGRWTGAAAARERRNSA